MYVQAGIAVTLIQTHWSLTSCNMTTPPASYRPAVFFHHIFVTVSFFDGHIQGEFKNIDVLV
jgi:hypothetical protein